MIRGFEGNTSTLPLQSLDGKGQARHEILSLPLFVAGVFAYNPHCSPAIDDLTLLAYPFN